MSIGCATIAPPTLSFRFSLQALIYKLILRPLFYNGRSRGYVGFQHSRVFELAAVRGFGLSNKEHYIGAHELKPRHTRTQESATLFPKPLHVQNRMGGFRRVVDSALICFRIQLNLSQHTLVDFISLLTLCTIFLYSAPRVFLACCARFTSSTVFFCHGVMTPALKSVGPGP